MKLALGAACILIGLALGAWQVRRYRERSTETLLEDVFDPATGFPPGVIAIPVFLVAGVALIWAHFDSL